MYQISIPQSNQDRVFTFKLKDTFKQEDIEFEVDIFMFACYSERFQNDISLIENGQYTIESDVSEDAFKSFLEACQGKAFIINNSNAYDFCLLSNEFQTSIFEKTIKNYYDANEDEILISKLSFWLSKDKENQNQNAINEIAEKISHKLEIMDKKFRMKLFELPLSNEMIETFAKNINENLELHSLIFNYIKSNKDVRKPDSKDKYLFSFIDLQALTPKEIVDFVDKKLYPDLYLSKNIFPYLRELTKKVIDQEKQIRSIKNSIQFDLNNYKNEYQDIRKSADDMKYAFGEVVQEATENIKSLQMFHEKADEISRSFESIQFQLQEKDSNELYPFQRKIDELESKIQKALIIKNPFDGIFHNLYILNDTNPVGNSVTINTPDEAIINPDFKPSNLLEFSYDKIDDCYYHKLNIKKDAKQKEREKEKIKESNWITFDFGQDFRVELIGYTIRTNSFGETFSHPKDFKIEGQNQEDNWELIDKKQNTVELNGSRKCHTFFLDDYSKPYQKIRFMQLDTHFPYEDRDLVMALSAIELHGRRQYIKND